MRAMIALAALAVGFTSCVTVAPYDRERLSRPDMEASAAPDLTAGADHAKAYREGASGAVGTSAGGCGCN